ncbi:MAG TPA: glutathione transferase GstA [Allosphingosinicella sp.]|uniref:glutathione transferase GstA n=1 Tax=Allosphingosinicella sp. TaxID=2823234 RepID=UPI002ED78BC6
MKLYFTPGACSQAPHIVLREAGLAFEPVMVDLKAKRTASGDDYRAINAKGGVPALGLDTGEVLTENAAILQYLADQAGGDLALPEKGIERYRLLEWLNYLATEVHKGFGPFWNPATPDSYKEATRAQLAGKFDYLERAIGDGPYLLGDRFSVLDAYAFTLLNWTRIHDIDIGRWPGLVAYLERVGARPAVQETLRAEGLI